MTTVCAGVGSGRGVATSGLQDTTMVWYRGCWRRMQNFFAARGVVEFSLDAAMACVTPPALRQGTGGLPEAE